MSDAETDRLTRQKTAKLYEKMEQLSIEGDNIAYDIQVIRDNLETMSALEHPVYLTEVSNLLQQLNTNRDAILKIAPKEDATAHRTQHAAIKRIALALLTALQPAATSFASQSPTSAHSCSANAPAASNIRLPQLELPTFNGEKSNWPSFSANFTSLLNRFPNLSDEEKLHYLQSSMKDSAKNLISYITPGSGSAYDEAWSLLETRFKNHRHTVFSIIRKILKAHPPTDTKGLERFIDQMRSSCATLSLLGLRPEDSNYIWNTVILEKCTQDVVNMYEQSLKDDRIPSTESLMNFLYNHVQVQAYTAKQTGSTTTPATTLATAVKPLQVNRPRTAQKCLECHLEHTMMKCPVFGKADIDDKWNIVKKHNLCTSCLSPGHNTRNCKSVINCRQCSKRHNTLLHRDSAATQQRVNLVTKAHHVLLQTALVHISGKDGFKATLRALIDQGSTTSLITANAAQLLHMKPRSINTSITGLGCTDQLSSKALDLNLSSTDGKFHTNLTALVIPKITSQVPEVPIHGQFPQLSGLQLADPSFNIPGRIDMLLGSDIIPKLQPGSLTNHPDAPSTIPTQLGVLLMGPVPLQEAVTHRALTLQQSSDDDVPDLSRFWEVEEVPDTKILTPEEEQCEETFKSTTYVLPQGTYCVKLPLKNDPPNIGESKRSAIARFMSLERKFKKDPAYKALHSATLQDYFKLDHIREVTKDIAGAYYLPHHGVVNSNRPNKLRIVFDASSKTSNSRSLNDELLNGPKTQPDLFDILLRFRMHNVALTADISQMYRRVMLNPAQYHLQRILWRDHPTEPLKEYELTTVTWGTKPAGYLSTRVLQDIAEKTTDPEVASQIKSNFYIDDWLFGAASVHQAKSIKTRTESTLRKAGFPLHKWASSHPDLTEEASETLITESATKTLGIKWIHSDDVFRISIPRLQVRKHLTKRSVLSDAGRLYDPLGWFAPITLQAKLFIQELWQDRSLTWDSKLPPKVANAWLQHMEDAQKISNFSIPRQVTHPRAVSSTLCGFSDASERAYAAVIILLQELNNGDFHSQLVAAKTKVAPATKHSLPRLELCGALLLSRLMKQVTAAIRIPHEVVAFTDSTITLAWITAHASKWKTFVAHRVQEIQQVIPAHKWFHVRSEDNIADLATRRMSFSELSENSAWWNGPSWLHCNWKHSQFPLPMPDQDDVPEQRLVHVVSSSNTSFLPCFENFSKTVRIMAYVKRALTPTALRPRGSIQAEEFAYAQRLVLRLIQGTTYSEDIQLLRRSLRLPRRSSLFKYNPFLDEHGLLRIGGRLQNANLDEDAKHPIVLPYTSPHTKIIIRHLHKLHEHAGPTLLAAIVLQQYYVPKLRNLTRFTTRTCTTCTRLRAKTCTQMMANLPPARLTPSRAFQSCGVDFAGPFTLRSHLSRGTKHYKGYVCLFVCMATRAIHVEIVSSLTAEGFLAAFSRFCSRRSTPARLYSDRGTNFTAAAKLLKRFHDDSMIADNLAQRSVSWHFNAPAAPHWGGIWEAGVKSVKLHLSAVVKSQVLTYEEFSTVTCRVEAILNSRPLTPLSNDPDELEALTPGHFLCGAPLTAPPEPFQVDNLLPNQRWQLVQHISQHFWQRWSREFLTRLNQRPKWRVKRPNLQVGSLVLIKENNLPPLKWRLGRVLKVHPSQDDLVRAATVRTQHGQCQRPITQLCPLPLDMQLDEQRHPTGVGEPKSHGREAGGPAPPLSPVQEEVCMVPCDSSQDVHLPNEAESHSEEAEGDVPTTNFNMSTGDAAQLGSIPLGRPTGDFKGPASAQAIRGTAKQVDSRVPANDVAVQPRRSQRLAKQSRLPRC